MSLVESSREYCVCYRDSMSQSSREYCVCYRDSMNVEDQFSRDCSLVDSIVTQQPVAQLFPSNIPVLPIDIVKGLERTAADR